MDIEAIVPYAGMSWEQWLPLRKGGGAELLVRVAHMEASPLAPGQLPIPPGFFASFGVPPAGAGPGAGVVPMAGILPPAAASSSVPNLQEALVGTFNEQVRGADAGEGGRYKAI